MEAGESRQGPRGALGGPGSCCVLGFWHPKVVDFCFLFSPWSRLPLIPVLVLVALRPGVSLWLWGEVGALLRGLGSKGALTLELRSQVCLGGLCGCSICSLWTRPGLAVPGKRTTRLERSRQLETPSEAAGICIREPKDDGCPA